MKNILLVFTILISVQSLIAQPNEVNKTVDSLYREDQIYFSITYNVIDNKLRNMSQNGFSGSFRLGFIRDFPINEERNLALGLGFGLSTNSFNQNMKISETNSQFEYEVLSSGNFDKNKFDLYQFEIPFEFRWRTSTATDYKFWRIYSGFKIGYVFSSRAKFVGTDESYKISINDAINRFQYGATLSLGYDSWNIHIYYALGTIFKDQHLESQSIELKTIEAGLIFYIL
ncbi:MAG: porin family protein [Flavobacteriaceae bacterium]|jgi:hypothetical protein|nr:PorT family protein [Flavobacteriaceae bacterium]